MSSDDEQYNEVCADCERRLGVNVGIFCLTHYINNEEKTVCDSCYDHDDHVWIDLVILFSFLFSFFCVSSVSFL